MQALNIELESMPRQIQMVPLADVDVRMPGGGRRRWWLRQC